MSFTPSPQILKLNITHSILDLYLPEIRYSPQQTILEVKQDLQSRFGTNTQEMSLLLRDTHNNDVCLLNNDYQSLQDYNVKSQFTIHCIDNDPHSLSKELNDVSRVEKYVMSDKDYLKRPNNVRKFKQQFLKNHPELKKQKQKKK